MLKVRTSQVVERRTTQVVERRKTRGVEEIRRRWEKASEPDVKEKLFYYIVVVVADEILN